MRIDVSVRADWQQLNLRRRSAEETGGGQSVGLLFVFFLLFL